MRSDLAAQRGAPLEGRRRLHPATHAKLGGRRVVGARGLPRACEAGRDRKVIDTLVLAAAPRMRSGARTAVLRSRPAPTESSASKRLARQGFSSVTGPQEAFRSR